MLTLNVANTLDHQLAEDHALQLLSSAQPNFLIDQPLMKRMMFGFCMGFVQYRMELSVHQHISEVFQNVNLNSKCES